MEKFPLSQIPELLLKKKSANIKSSVRREDCIRLSGLLVDAQLVGVKGLSNDLVGPSVNGASLGGVAGDNGALGFGADAQGGRGDGAVDVADVEFGDGDGFGVVVGGHGAGAGESGEEGWEGDL